MNELVDEGDIGVWGLGFLTWIIDRFPIESLMVAATSAAAAFPAIYDGKQLPLPSSFNHLNKFSPLIG